MTSIESIIKNNTIEEAYDAMGGDDVEIERYLKESMMVGFLAIEQLNCFKNKNKPDFEDMDLKEIIDKLYEECDELEKELTDNKINYKRALSELGDVAATLSGILAWIMEKKREKNELH